MSDDSLVQLRNMIGGSLLFLIGFHERQAGGKGIAVDGGRIIFKIAGKDVHIPPHGVNPFRQSVDLTVEIVGSSSWETKDVADIGNGKIQPAQP